MGRLPIVVVALVLAASPAVAGAEADPAAEIRRLVEEQARLRERIDAQQRQIDDLLRRPAPADEPTPALREAVERMLAERPAPAAPLLTDRGAPMLTRAGSKLSVYGFVRLDALRDGGRPNNTQTIAYILSDDAAAPAGDAGGDFTMHARLTRLGFDFDGGASEALCANVTGKLEVDFYGSGPESRAGLRMRHAYLTLRRGAWQVLAGQTADLAAPLNPVVNADFAMWGAGNLGDRRPQVRLEYAPEFECGTLFLQGMAGLTGAVDAKDLDANGFRDGESGRRPTLQVRAAWRVAGTGKLAPEIGAWVHASRDGPDAPIAGDDEFRSRAVGADLTLPLAGDDLWLRAEAWTGRNLSDLRGGILQGVNPATGDEVRARGGWAEVGVRVSPRVTLHVGAALDDPRDGDLPSAARARNSIQWVAARFDLDPVEVGIEFLRWTTEWTDLEAGRDPRVGAFVAYRF